MGIKDINKYIQNCVSINCYERQKQRMTENTEEAHVNMRRRMYLGKHSTSYLLKEKEGRTPEGNME